MLINLTRKIIPIKNQRINFAYQLPKNKSGTILNIIILDLSRFDMFF